MAAPTDEYWSQLGLRITLYGACYAPLVASIWVVVLFGGELIKSPSSYRGPTPVEVIFAPLFAVPFLFGIGFIWSGTVALFTTPLVAGAMSLLKEQPPRDSAGMFTGAAIAFVSTLPLGLGAGAVRGDYDVLQSAVLFGHVALAIVLGQAAGAFASLSDLRRRYRGRLQRGPFRFTLGRMLVGMIPLSIVLSLFNAIELLSPAMGIASVGAVATAAATHRPVAWLANRWLDRRLRRRRPRRLGERST